MDGELAIQPAQPGDVADLASLRGGGDRLEQCMLGYLQGTYSPSLAKADREVFVAKVNGEFAGYAAGHRSTRYDCEGELQWMNVAQHFQGKGISDALIRRMFDWFIAHSIYRVCVNVAPDNIVASKFYRRHGASDLNAYWLVWPDLRLAASFGGR